jgi:hypothetical protein
MSGLSSLRCCLGTVCRVAGIAALVSVVMYVSIARPHIGWGPALTFTSVHPPEASSLAETRDWLSRVAEALTEDGYHHSVLQVFSPGQVFGLVKPIDSMWEYHVRGFVDGRLEGEIELSRDYFQHLSNDYRADAAAHLVELLDAAGIDWMTHEPLPEMVVPPLPEQPVSWKHLVLLSPVFQALLSLDDAVRTA